MKADNVQSPFLPGTKIQFAWDSTSLSYLKTCPRLYYYTMIEGWSPKGEPIHLRFGIEYHQALHDFEKYKAEGAPYDDALRNTIRDLLIRIHNWHPDPSRDSEKVKSKDNLVRTVIWYLDKFREDQAETVILANGLPAMEVSFKFELDWGPATQYIAVHERDSEAADADEKHNAIAQPYLLCGHLDRVVEYSNSFFVMDRKTTSMTLPSSYYFNRFEPNNQMTLYSFAGQVVLGSPIRGVIIDAAQIAMGFSRFERGITYRTPDSLEEWLEDLQILLKHNEDYADADYWPMNDTACDKFGGCRFREVCSKSTGIRQNFLRSDFDQLPLEERWNPLKPRT